MVDLPQRFKALSEWIGAPIDLSKGAIRLQLGEYGPWWLELDPGASMLTIQHTVARFSEPDAKHWLALNTDLRLLGGAWLGLHLPSSTVRLMLHLDLDRFDATDLVNVMGNLLELRPELPMPLSETEEPTAAGAPENFMSV